MVNSEVINDQLLTVDPGGGGSTVNSERVNSEAIDDQQSTVNSELINDQQSTVRGLMVNSEVIDDQQSTVRRLAINTVDC